MATNLLKLADEILARNPGAEQAPVYEGAGNTLSDSLRKGWSSGIDTMGADVNQIVGLGAEAMGADNFAQGRYRAAQGLREDAQRNAPSIHSLDQVDGVGNALRWGVGQIGAMGPTALGVVGGTVATGNPFVGGALAMGLPEAGDIAYRQTQDPQTMEQGAGTRLTKALAGGAASGAVQAAGPGLLMGKVAKGAGAGLLKQTTGQIIGRNFAEGVGVNALAEGGSEAIKQFAANPDAPFNTGAIGESALAGGVLGVPFGALGAGVDIAKASPGKTWIGAKKVAQGGVENARSALNGVGEALGSTGEALAHTWEAVKGHVDAGMTAAQTGAKDAWAAMPEGLKGVGEFVKTGVEDQIASARTAYKNIMSDANVPDALKAQAQEWGSNLVSTANRAYLWSADKMRGVGEKAKDAVPEDVVGRLREFSKPAGDMLDTILNSESMADTKEFAGKTLDQAKEMLKGRREKAAKWLGPKMDELMDRADVSDERKQQVADLRDSIGDSAAQAKAATILKAQKLADAAKPKLDAAYKKVGEAFSKLFPEDQNVKKSDDHSGMNALIFDKIGPMIKEAKPELLEDADSTMKLGSTLRMFMAAAAEGKDLRVAGIHTAMTDLLGPDLAHDVLNAAHEFATGGDQTKQANYFKHLTDSVKEKASMDNLETVITKNLSNEASGRTGVAANPRELAKYLRGWARGDYAVGKPREQVEYEDQEVHKFLEAHFGTNAKKVLDALQKDVEGERGKQKAGIGEEGGMDFESTGEYDTNITYHGVKEVGDTPKLYESDRSVKNNGGGGQYGSAVEQAIKKLKAEHPDMNVSFVKLTDYAKAHNLNEEQIARLAEGKDPSQHGFIKKERIKNDDGLEEYQLRAMRGKIKSDKHPDAIGVEGRSENYVYDSRRIANVMHLGAKGEWSKFDNDTGMHGRLAQKFAEGIAKLTAYEGHNLKVRDDHVIAVLDGKNFTWGEAQKMLKQRDETEVPKHLKDVSASEMKLHDAVSGLTDQELQKALGQYTDVRDAKIEGVAEGIRAAVRSEMGFAAKGSNKAAQINRVVRERISAHMKDEKTKIPPLERIIRSVENELAKRSGEDQRSEVMDVGMETRQGIDISKQHRGMDGYDKPGTLLDIRDRKSGSGEADNGDARVIDLVDRFLNLIGEGGVGKPGQGRLRAQFSDVERPMLGGRTKVDASDVSRRSERAILNNERLDGTERDTARIKAAPEQKRESLGSGRTHGDREGQIHDAAATVSAKDMERNTQGLHGEPANARPVLLRAAEVRRSDSAMKNVVADRLMTLAKNMQMMSAKDQAELTRAVSLSSIVDLKDAIDPTARKYADRIVPAGEKAESAWSKGPIEKNPVRFDRYGKATNAAPAEPTKSLKATLDEHADYIDNPPWDFSVERAREIAKWAERQEARLKEAKAKLEEKGGDEFERLEGMYYDAGLLKERAREVIKSEEDATEMGLRDEGTPDPKVVAAKKAAFLERAVSGDKALIKELSESTDAKGLQRAVEALYDVEGADEALQAANKRLSELVQDPSTAYGLQTKKYSLISSAIHAELERSGFAATHDSPIKHEGRFDWRAHRGKGEGNAAFGAGTYLSTAEGVHKSYKEQFTAAVQRINPVEGDVVIRGRKGSFVVNEDGEVDVHLPEGTSAEKEVVEYMIGGRTFAEAVESTKKSADRWFKESLSMADVPALADARERMEERKTIQQWIVNSLPESLKGSAERWNRFVTAHNAKMADLAQIGKADIRLNLPLNAKSPTYEVSVDIKPEQLLDWGKPLSEQSEVVRGALVKAGFEDNSAEIVKARARFDKTDRALKAVAQGDPVDEEVRSPKAYEKAIDERRQALFDLDWLTENDLTGRDAYRRLVEKFGSQAEASDYLQSLGILGHKYAASGGKNDTHPNYVIYDDSKIITNYVHFDAQKSAGTPLTAKGRAQILAYLNTVAPWVQAEFPFLSHAGEFTKEFGQAIVRVSTHALNPTSVAYHESLHAFFQHLKENSSKDISQVVMDAASSPAVTSQLRKLLAHSPEALKQLSDPEERAAYMYQFWADGKLTLAEKPTTLFQKITAAFRKVLGIWSNDERALHIMEYFHSGEYAQNVGKQSAVRAALMEKGHNTAVDKMQEMGGKFMEVGDALWGAGSARLRDSKSEALHELADLVKRKGTDVGEDRGYIPAARLKRTEFITQMAEGLAGADETVMHEALEALQGGTKPTSLEARKAYASVRKVLDDMFDYLHQSGVDTGDLGYGKDYFPRHWDSNYLSKHEAEFMDMARKYPQWADAKDTYNKLLANDGSELRVADRPGMQANKRRVLSFIADADAAPFMSKNLPEIMNGYITQATRRGEWARRFGDDNARMGKLLDRARREGASKAEIEHAQNFVAGVNGTLGDTLNPTLRRYMGNMVVYQNIRLLPLAIFSSVVDPMGVMVRGGTVGNAWSTFKRGIREVPAGLKGREITDYWTGMAQALGTIDNASLQHALGSLYTQGMVGGTAKKINDAFFKYNLMEQFNQSMRVGATEAAVGFITKHADGKASQHSIRWIAELGLRGGDVKVTNGRMATTVAEGLTEAQAARVKSAVNQWVDGAVLRPDAADKPTWMNDPHFMLVSHLKQFVYSFHHTILDRVMHEMRHQNYAPAIALSSYVPIMIASDMLKGLIQGGGSEPEWKRAWGPGEYLGNGVERAGLFGVGQFGVDALQGNFGSLAGPTLGQMADGFEVLDGVKQFKTFAVHSLPANQLYAGALRAGAEDPKFVE